MICQFNKILKYSIIIVLLYLPLHISGQEKVLVKNNLENGKNAVLVKWYIRELYTSDGFNIYRKGILDKEWEKINEQPVRFGDFKISPDKVKNDELLEMLVEMSGESPSDKLDDMAQFTMILKSIIDNNFARYLGIFYCDSTIRKNEMYTYKVTRIKGSGEKTIAISESVMSDSVSVIDPPDSIILTPNNASVYFKWKPEPERYFAVNIYRKDSADGDFIKVNELPVIVSQKKTKEGNMVWPDFLYTDHELINGKEYTYLVKSIDFFGYESSFNKTFKAVPADPAPPAKPKDVKARFEDKKVIITWNYKNTESITGYNIYRGQKSKGIYVKLNQDRISPDVLSYTDESYIPGNYYYYVTSINKFGIEGESALAFVEVPDLVPPVKPVILSLTADTGKFILKWKANTETDLKGYDIYRKPEDAPMDQFFKITRRPVVKNEYIDKIPENVKNTFVYYIIAIDSSENKSEASGILSANLPDVTPPVRPYIKTVKITDKGFMISWEPNVEKDMKGYLLFRSSDENGQDEAIQLTEVITKSTSRYLDESVQPGVKYSYKLIALDLQGNKSEFSEEYSIQKYLKPDDNAIELKNIKVKYISRGSKNQFSWKMPENTSGYVGAMIYRKEDTTNYKACSGLLTDNNFTDKNIQKDKIYYYELRTFTETGKKWKSETFKISTK